MRTWTIETHRETDGGVPSQDALDTYVDRLSDAHAAIRITPQGRLSSRLTITATDLVSAIAVGSDAEESASSAAGFGGRVTAVTAADAATPDGDAAWIRTPLLNLSDIGKRLGISRQRASQLANDHPRFPPAAVRTSNGALYEEAAIRVFETNWLRKSGRPPGTTSP